MVAEHCPPFLRGATAPSGPGPLHCRSFTITLVGLLWTSDQPVAETSTWQHATLTRDKKPMPPVGFKPTIPASERPQTYALDCAATGIGEYWLPCATFCRGQSAEIVQQWTHATWSRDDCVLCCSLWAKGNRDCLVLNLDLVECSCHL